MTKNKTEELAIGWIVDYLFLTICILEGCLLV